MTHWTTRKGSTRPRRRLCRLRLLPETLEDRTTPAAVPSATFAVPPSAPLIGENTQFTVRFDNTSPTDTGYGPYIDLFLPATGIDGRVAPPADGLSFV